MANATSAVKLVKYAAVLVLAIAVLIFVIHISTGSTKPTEETIHHMVVQKVEELGRLELVRYHIKDVVEEKIERAWYQGGDTRVLVIVSGEAVGCVNMQAIQDKDIQTTGDHMLVHLPAPELCYAKVNHNESKVYDAPTSPFTNNADAVDRAYRDAENKIGQSALDMGLLSETRTNAVKLLQPLLEKLSGKPVQIVFDEPAPKKP